VVERVSIEMPPNSRNRAYLVTKRDKLGHLLTLAPAPPVRSSAAPRRRAPARAKGRNKR
jgi:3,4-dihydroxy 2-butanone 4-phosphate synthase / GTP cyclohydrolase II